MKKLAFVVVLVAVIVGIVFGGIALASPAPKPASGSAYMDTFSGNVTSSNQILQALAFSYPQVRHVSITLEWWGLDTVADNIIIYCPVPAIPTVAVDTITDASFPQYGGSTTCEFNTDNWNMYVDDFGGGALTVWYKVTVTYPK